MKKNLKIKKAALVIMMSLIVLSVLSVTGYAVNYQQVDIMLLANTEGGFISAIDNSVGYTSEFSYGHSYSGGTPLWISGYVMADPNTDRGGTAGGNIQLSVEEKNLFLWLNHSSIPSSSKSITIENSPYYTSYTIEAKEWGSCGYTNGKTYRGRFQVSLLCGAEDAYKVRVHPAMNYRIYIDQ